MKINKKKRMLPKKKSNVRMNVMRSIKRRNISRFYQQEN